MSPGLKKMIGILGIVALGFVLDGWLGLPKTAGDSLGFTFLFFVVSAVICLFTCDPDNRGTSGQLGLFIMYVIAGAVLFVANLFLVVIFPGAVVGITGASCTIFFILTLLVYLFI